MTVATLAALAALAAWRAARTEGLYHWCAQAVQLLATILLLVVAFGGDVMARKRDKGGAVAEKQPPNGRLDGNAKLAEAVELFRAGRFAEARAAYLAAGAAGADQILAYHGAANCSFLMGEDEQLKSDSIKLHGFDRGKAHFWRGQMYRRNGDRAKAEHELEMAVVEGYTVAAGSLASLRQEIAASKKGG